MHRYLVPAIAAGILIIASALLQGKWTERWSKREVTATQLEFAQRLARIPTEFGDWTSKEVPADPQQLEAARAVGHYQREFRNRLDPTQVVSVFIVCGHGRDMTQHTPDQCYKASGYLEDDHETKYFIDNLRPAEIAAADGAKAAAEPYKFTTNRFRKGDAFAGAQTLRIFWSFSEEGEWVAPTVAKYALAGSPAVFKVYAITEVRGDRSEAPQDSAARNFLQEFMPRLNEALFTQLPAATPAGSDAPAAPAPTTAAAT